MNKAWLLPYFIAIATNCAYPGIVKGKVYSSEDSSPLVDVSITAITDSIHMFNTRSGNSGDFSISLPEASSECRILIQLTGYSPYSVSVNNPTQVLDLGKISLTPNAKELDAVEVTASAGRVINLPDKKIIFPNKLEKERATNPLNLLSQISFAATSLSVDEFSETIKIGGNTPQILINGVKRGMSDFNALDPADILKIEYITHKDMRYGNPYINIVTRKKSETGGSVMANISAPVTTRQENHQLYSSFRHGANEIAVNYSGGFRDSRKEYSDALEKYIYPDKEINECLYGSPSRNLDRFHNVNVDYTLLGGAKKMLLVSAFLEYHSQDKDNIQTAEMLSDSYRRTTTQGNATLKPGMSIYGSLPISDNGRIEVSVAGAYQNGKYNRSLFQTNGYMENTHTLSDSYNINGDIYFQQSFSWSRLEVGATYKYTHSSNDYTISGISSNNKLHKNSLTAYAALSGQIGRIAYYYAAGGVTYTHVQQGYTNPYAYVMLQKNFNILNIGYSFQTSAFSDGMTSYNDEIIPVNEILYRKGNLNLKDALSIKNQLTASINYKKFSANLNLNYNQTSNSSITVCEYEDNKENALYGKFIETTVNSRRQKDFGTSLTVGFSNLFDHLSFQVYGSYNNQKTFFSDYKWEKCNFMTGGYAAVYFGRWQFNTQIDLIPSYSLIGNMIWRNYTSWSVGASWHKGSWTISCTLSDLFSKKAFYQERTTMAINAIRQSKSWIADKNNWVSFSIRYQLNYGKKLNKPDRNVWGNTNVDSGVNTNY